MAKFSCLKCHAVASGEEGKPPTCEFCMRTMQEDGQYGQQKNLPALVEKRLAVVH